MSEAPALPRVAVVWVCFLVAMTLAGAMFFGLSGGPAPRTDGVSLSALAATTIGGSGSPNLTQTRRPLDAARWQAIVIHHSGSAKGDPASIEREHKAQHVNGQTNGLGHHFIIGNGNGMDDGEVRIGYRWLDQLPGAHAAGESGRFYNEHGISICLVGDGNRSGFTQAQVQQLATLVDSLRRQLGFGADRVLLHSDIAPVSDPGRLFPAGLHGLPVGHAGR